MQTPRGHQRWSGLSRRLPAGFIAAALALSAGTAAALAAQGTAYAGDSSSGDGTKSKSKWLVDSALATMYDVNNVIDAPSVWSKSDASGQRLTGKGVGVALIDSGVAPVKGLTQAGKVVNGPDLSFESQAPNLTQLDTFGHGTHMAGIIAGRDPDTPIGKENDPRYFVGVAPDAQLVNLKVGSADGATDVSQIIAAIDWAVAHRKDPGLNIRVINLSFGTDSVQDPRLDPLSYAVEAAWRAGIVVVVSVGNDGAAQARVSNPAINPYVIAVGAADTMGTDGQKDDLIGQFSTRGDTFRHADLVAPGRSVGSLRDPGAFVDVNYPGGLVADGTGRFFKGSGTSQAAAVVSGAVALLLQQRPTLTPDQVKQLLTSTAVPLPNGDPIAQGAGELNIKAATEAKTSTFTAQAFLPALGTGSLEGARGSAHVVDPATGVELTGEQDIMGQPWDPATWTVAAATGTAWSGGMWNGNIWAGSDFGGSSWTARTWSSMTWTARTWSGGSWQGRTWSSAGWTGDGWDSRTWSDSTWSSRTWSGGSWNSTTWK
jgi:serine protease AprX